VVAQPDPANFTGTLLYSANLNSTIMEGANFTDAFMHASTIQISAFQGANMTDASLGSVIIMNSNFTGADFTGTVFPNALWYHSVCPNGVLQDSLC
jgi:uncharacterized protein YjbI with pentapeptide repeats